LEIVHVSKFYRPNIGVRSWRCSSCWEAEWWHHGSV